MLEEIRDFIITKIAGKLLIFMGVLGVLADLNYDNMVTRAVEGGYVFGWAQVLAMIFFVIVIFVGYILNKFTKDL